MNRTILTVDDSEDVRIFLALILRLGGYRVIEAVDGADGIEKLNLHKVDMVITDLNMPNLDGIGFIRSIRKSAASCNLPVIVLTGESRESLKQEGMAAGATDWIVKPFPAKQLLTAVKSVLG